MLRWLRRGGGQPAQVPGGLAVATQQVNRAYDRERELRQHQQRRHGWLAATAPLGSQCRQVVRALAWQRRATGLAVEADRPSYVLEALGPVPASTRGRRAWRHAAAEIEQYRHTYQITDPDRALGPEPHAPGQRADRQRARTAIARSRPSIGPPTAAVIPSRPANAPTSRDLAGTMAGPARSGPPASTTRKEASMARPQRFPFDDEDRPSGSVRPLSQADLQAILATSATTPTNSWPARRGPAGGGGAGAGQRGPAGRLGPSEVATAAGG